MGETAYRTMTDIVYEHILRQVHTGVLKPGDRIVIERITQELNIGRTPVREAVKQLASEGILTLDPYKSPRVREISPHDIRDIYEVRKILEPQAAVLALEHLSPGDLRTLRRLCDEAERAVARQRIEEYIALNKDFHFLIYERSGNKWLLKYIDLLWYFARWVNVPTLFDHTTTERYLGSHASICDAIETKNAEALEAALVAHLDDALDSTLTELSQLERDSSGNRAEESA